LYGMWYSVPYPYCPWGKKTSDPKSTKHSSLNFVLRVAARIAPTGQRWPCVRTSGMQVFRLFWQHYVSLCGWTYSVVR
jgi:hypothetical protein